MSLTRPSGAHRRSRSARHRGDSRSTHDLVGVAYTALYLLLMLADLALINVAVWW